MFNKKLINLYMTLAFVSIIFAGPGITAAQAQSSSPVMYSLNKNVDLSGVDLCTMVPQSEISKITGPIRAMKNTITINRGKACSWVNMNGQFFEIAYSSPDQWDSSLIAMKDVKPLNNLGDGAFEAQYPDALRLEVLARNRAVINVRVSNDNLDSAIAFYRIGLKYLPQN